MAYHNRTRPGYIPNNPLSIRRAILTKSTTQSAWTAIGEAVAITWQSTDHIDSSYFSYSGSQLTVSNTGIYDICASMVFDNKDAGRFMIDVQIKVNGTTLLSQRAGMYSRGSAYNDEIPVNLSLLGIDLTADDYIEVIATVNDADGVSGADTIDANCTLTVTTLQ